MFVVHHAGTEEIHEGKKLRFQVPVPKTPQELAEVLSLQNAGPPGNTHSVVSPSQGRELSWNVSNADSPFLAAARYDIV